MDYEWTDDMREISGFGGSYEAACRAMVSAGAKFLDELSDEERPAFAEYRNVIGMIDEQKPAAKRMTHVMVEAGKTVGDGPTGAMVQASVHHALRASKLGWSAYVAEMEAAHAAEMAAERAKLQRYADEPYGGSHDRPYAGQPHTFQGQRGQLQVSGLTLRDVGDCMRRGIAEVPGVDRAIDSRSCIQNAIIEIEKLMGVYPGFRPAAGMDVGAPDSGGPGLRAIRRIEDEPETWAAAEAMMAVCKDRNLSGTQALYALFAALCAVAALQRWTYPDFEGWFLRSAKTTFEGLAAEADGRSS